MSTMTADAVRPSEAPKRDNTRRSFQPKKDKQVATTITDADNDRLLELCEAEQKTPAALLRELLLERLDAKGA